MKNSADLGEYYPPRPLASVDNTLFDLDNSSYPTQPHSIIAKYPETVFSKIATFFLHITISSKRLKERTMQKCKTIFNSFFEGEINAQLSLGKLVR